jgi:hypothetical protein
MNFKKDYINYVLHNTLQSESAAVSAARKVLEKIISADDFFKITFIIGKTAGLELLFKYLLYISDKVDKSQITIFNLKDNYEYDVNNLKRICSRLQIKEPPALQEIEETAVDENHEDELEENNRKEPIHIDIEEKAGNDEEIKEETDELKKLPDESSEESSEESYKDEKGMSLIENRDSDSTVSSEVFELESINRSLEENDSEADVEQSIDETVVNDEPENEVIEEEIKSSEELPESGGEPEYSETIEEETQDKDNEKNIIEEPQLEIEVRKPTHTNDVYTEKQQEEKEEKQYNDSYNKFEHKYHEEIKILEKLFSYVEKECKNNGLKTLNDRTLQSFNEIIEISAGLTDLTRQLSFDLIADIFLTLNLYFSKAVKDTSIINVERIRLFDSSLGIVHSLLKGENYLDYDDIISKVEALKEILSKPLIDETTQTRAKSETEENDTVKMRPLNRLIDPPEIAEVRMKIEKETLIKKHPAKRTSGDNIIFKMKYLIKEFEKNFKALENITGEYSKFTALEKIDELNSYLRMLAKIAAAVKLNDILKLAEVSYVFLKYLKDYRMNLLDAEIQQIIKYVIFTFKMLLTDRKPEDFNVLVQYLNNPVKIFADSN